MSGEKIVTNSIIVLNSIEKIGFFPHFRIYLCKQWHELAVFNDHTSSATGVRFGANADYLASTSMDRTVKFYGLEKK